MAYRVFDHTADLGIEVTAATLEELYAEAAHALFALLTDLRSVRAGQSRAVEVEGENPTDLLINFLREVLYAWNGEGFLMKRCSIREVTPARITAVLTGEKFDPARHRIVREIKAVTYHRSELRQTTDGGYAAQVVFDI
ncbi:MAG: archease [Deltaproteobacteria bacterium]|nr:archease [Deltaproteobacteria bacterium]